MGPKFRGMMLVEFSPRLPDGEREEAVTFLLRDLKDFCVKEAESEGLEADVDSFRYDWGIGGRLRYSMDMKGSNEDV